MDKKTTIETLLPQGNGIRARMIELWGGRMTRLDLQKVLF